MHHSTQLRAPILGVGAPLSLLSGQGVDMAIDPVGQFAFDPWAWVGVSPLGQNRLSCGKLPLLVHSLSGVGTPHCLGQPSGVYALWLLIPFVSCYTRFAPAHCDDNMHADPLLDLHMTLVDRPLAWSRC